MRGQEKSQSPSHTVGGLVGSITLLATHLARGENQENSVCFEEESTEDTQEKPVLAVRKTPNYTRANRSPTRRKAASQAADLGSQFRSGSGSSWETGAGTYERVLQQSKITRLTSLSSPTPLRHKGEAPANEAEPSQWSQQAYSPNTTVTRNQTSSRERGPGQDSDDLSEPNRLQKLSKMTKICSFQSKSRLDGKNILQLLEDVIGGSFLTVKLMS